MGPVQTRLEKRIADGVLIKDVEQIEAASELDSRLEALSEYEGLGAGNPC